jgi:phosphoribosylanthranilate isomerase
MIVKICGITNPDDALAACEGGAAALGFIFHPDSPRYITPQRAASIAAILPTSIWKVGLFVNRPPEEMARIRSEVGLDILQLQGDESPEQMPAAGRIWKALHVDESFDRARLSDYPVEAILLDSPAGPARGGTGRTFDWAKVVNTGRRIVLAGGLDANNVRQAIKLVRPWGVDACSRIEASPGRKDHTKMALFLKAALAEVG